MVRLPRATRRVSNLVALGLRNEQSLTRRGCIAFVLYLLLLWRSSLQEPPLLDASQSVLWHNLVSRHQVLWRYVIRKATRFMAVLSLALRQISTHAVAAPVYAVDFVNKQTLGIQQVLQARIEVWLDEQINTLGEKVKTLIKDPFMPKDLLTAIDDTVDIVLPDIKLALLMKTDEFFVQYRPPVSAFANETSTAALAGGNHNALEDLPPDGKHDVPEAQLPPSDDVDLLLDQFDDDDDEGTANSPRRRTESVARHMDSVSRHTDSPQGRTDSPSRGPLVTWQPLQIWPWPSPTTTSTPITTLVERDDTPDLTKWNPRTIRRPVLHVPSTSDLWAILKSTRAYILYTLYPFDKSIWQNLRHVPFLLLTCVGLVPRFGVIWWLFLFLLHNKSDEFGMYQFIIGFQTAKYFSQGCFSLLQGAFLYYLCANRTEPTCVVNGPRVSDYTDALGFALQVVLVWSTFFLLPFTRPCSQQTLYHGKSRAVPLHHPNRVIDRSLDVARNPTPNMPPTPRAVDRNKELKEKVDRTRARRLLRLFWWDTFSMLLVMGLAVVAVLWGQEDWQLRTTFYWLRTMYGLLSMPFVLFKLPLMGGLLTQAKATGYDAQGHVVLRVNKNKTFQPPPDTDTISDEIAQNVSNSDVAMKRRASSVGAYEPVFFRDKILSPTSYLPD